MVPGAHIHLSKDGENALYIILSGSVKAEVNKRDLANTCFKQLFTTTGTCAAFVRTKDRSTIVIRCSARYDGNRAKACTGARRDDVYEH